MLIGRLDSDDIALPDRHRKTWDRLREAYPQATIWSVVKSYVAPGIQLTNRSPTERTYAVTLEGSFTAECKVKQYSSIPLALNATYAKVKAALYWYDEKSVDEL